MLCVDSKRACGPGSGRDSGRLVEIMKRIATAIIRKSAFFWNILKPGKIGFFSACLNTETLKKSVSGHFSIFQTHCNFPDNGGSNHSI